MQMMFYTKEMIIYKYFGENIVLNLETNEIFNKLCDKYYIITKSKSKKYISEFDAREIVSNPIFKELRLIRAKELSAKLDGLESIHKILLREIEKLQDEIGLLRNL